LVAALLIVIFYPKNFRENTITPKYEDSTAHFKQLYESERASRLVLSDSVSLLVHRDSLHIEAIKQVEQEILKIKGRYNKHTPSELELEMERRAK
jgi:hypothetical protein